MVLVTRLNRLWFNLIIYVLFLLRPFTVHNVFPCYYGPNKVIIMSTQLGLCETHSNKQGVKDPTYKNADVAIFTALSKQMKEQGYMINPETVERQWSGLRSLTGSWDGDQPTYEMTKTTTPT